MNQKSYSLLLGCFEVISQEIGKKILISFRKETISIWNLELLT